METLRPDHSNKQQIWIYVILVASASLAALLAVKNIKLSSDSLSYGLVSQQILAGNGIRIPMIRFDNLLPVDGTVPFLVRPPLVPIFFALFGGVTPQSFLAAQIINVISHVTIAIFTFLLMKQFSNRSIALLTGVLVSLSFPILSLTHHMWSETIFIATTVAAMYYLTLYRQSNCLRHFFFASICASTAILTRYAGIVLIVVFAWEAFNSIRRGDPKTKFKSVILPVLLPVATIVVLFARNYLYLGTIRGVTLPTPERSFLEAVEGTIRMLFLQFHLGPRSIALITIFIVIFTLYVAISTNARKELSKYLHQGLDSSIVFILSYTALICVTMAKDQPVFEVRYVNPLVPFLFVIGILAIVFIWQRLKLHGFAKLSLTGMIVSLGIVSLASCYKSYLYLPEFSYKQEGLYSILNTCTHEWLNEHYKRDTIIVTDKPYRLSFFGEYPTVILPNRKYVPNAHIPENMDYVLPYRMSEIGAHVLALFRDVTDQKFGSYVAGLFNKRASDDKFNLAYECSDGVIYELKKSSSSE